MNNSSFTVERLKILLKLYSVKEGSIKEISQKIKVSIPQLAKIKPWLIERKVLVSQGTIFIKKSTRNVQVEYFMVNAKAIDYIILRLWDETNIIFKRIEEETYAAEDDIEKY